MPNPATDDDKREKVQPAEERGERTENALAIARGGKSEGDVPGATPSADSAPKPDTRPRKNKPARSARKSQ